MVMTNEKIADLFNQYADLLELSDANRFRVRAYRNAAKSIHDLSDSLPHLIESGFNLKSLPYIGDDLSKKIIAMIKTGELPELNRLKKRIPTSLSELMQLEGLGAKRVQTLHKKLHVQTIDDLINAMEKGKLNELPGFGKGLEEKIKNSLALKKKFSGRIQLTDAIKIAEPLKHYLNTLPGVIRVEIVGSYRRRKETIGDLDILVVTNDDININHYLEHYSDTKEMIASGKIHSTIRLQSGLQVDVYLTSIKNEGAALIHFTGSKEHNIALRKLAQEKGFKMNQYGLFNQDTLIAEKTENEIYHAIGLSYIEPELREDRGEILAASKNQLPHLVTIEDILGDLHCHTQASDGRNSIEEIADSARRHNYQYIAITDHSKHLVIANGLSESDCLKQIKAIDALNERLDGITLLKAIEVDILETGALDFSNEILEQLDLTVCSIHSHFGLSEKKQTERIIRAMDNRYFNILGHPTGRLLGKRNAYTFDIEKVMQAAKERHCYLELNAQPDRLDLNDEYCRMAKHFGVKLAISTDTHHVKQFDYMQLGIFQARRGWLEKKDVLNTLSLPNLKKALKRM